MSLGGKDFGKGMQVKALALNRVVLFFVHALCSQVEYRRMAMSIRLKARWTYGLYGHCGSFFFLFPVQKRIIERCSCGTLKLILKIRYTMFWCSLTRKCTMYSQKFTVYIKTAAYLK